QQGHRGPGQRQERRGGSERLHPQSLKTRRHRRQLSRSPVLDTQEGPSGCRTSSALIARYVIPSPSPPPANGSASAPPCKAPPGSTAARPPGCSCSCPAGSTPWSSTPAPGSCATTTITAGGATSSTSIGSSKCIPSRRALLHTAPPVRVLR